MSVVILHLLYDGDIGVPTRPQHSVSKSASTQHIGCHKYIPVFKDRICQTISVCVPVVLIDYFLPDGDGDTLCPFLVKLAPGQT